MADMKAWQLAHPGEVQTTLKLNTVPRPSAQSLKAQDILIRVISTAINPADYKVPAMGFAARAIIAFPKTPAMDLSGEVVAVGAGVTDILVGDHVMARVSPLKRPGALSEYLIAHRDGYAKLSRDVDLDVAAAVGTAGLTAYQTIKPYVKPGDKIFINGGSGGVGTFGIQIAKLLGCHVTVSCSTGKAELCRSLGADEIIDYKKTDVVDELTKLGRVFSLIVDNVGYDPPNLYPKTGHVLLPEGVFVVVAAGKHAGHAATAVGNLIRPSFLGGGKNKMVMYLTANNHDDWNALAGWLNEGKVTAVIEKTFEFGDALKAFEHLQGGSTGGKVVIHVSKKE
ncbi:alcohol dehydrogenase superfamily, zinc-type [Pochonia chlamydosporia 170]|uniref:Alcohol dehydrogenase superfamily, zinc-type n=1 Tax=Pochonia chlamydosporia 170 TaxID=1380566 RepID=A0A179FQ03_METCM|nr:alcohol dehydrogenase superfamily, zinc-type [Pochonia chlamydosporia 170]OAQ67705.1 alcohol dehydrogenase superfamily, zinc-type [Pochonia chlamydosporia 170]